MAVLQDGTLASASGDTTIHVWYVKTGQIIKMLTGHASYVESLAVLQDGTLASGSYDTTIRVWDVKTGKQSRC